jgi:hypothetical protein
MLAVKVEMLAAIVKYNGHFQAIGRNNSKPEVFLTISLHDKVSFIQ